MSRENPSQVGYWVHKLKSGPGLPEAVWQNFSIFSGLFEGICRLVAKRSTTQQFLEFFTTKTCTHRVNGSINVE